MLTEEEKQTLRDDVAVLAMFATANESVRDPAAFWGSKPSRLNAAIDRLDALLEKLGCPPHTQITA